MGLFFKRKNKSNKEESVEVRETRNKGANTAQKGQADSLDNDGAGSSGIESLETEAELSGAKEIKVTDSKGEYLWNTIDDFSRSSNKEVRSNLQIPGFYMGSGKNIPEMSDETTEELLADIRSGSTEVHIDGMKISRSKDDFEPRQYQRRRRSGRRTESGSPDRDVVKLTAQEKYEISRGKSRLDSGSMGADGFWEGDHRDSPGTAEGTMNRTRTGQTRKEVKAGNTRPVAAAGTGRKEPVAAAGTGKEEAVAAVEAGGKEAVAAVEAGRKEPVAAAKTGREEAVAAVEAGREEPVTAVETGKEQLAEKSDAAASEAGDGQPAEKPETAASETGDGQSAEKSVGTEENWEEPGQEDKWKQEDDEEDDDSSDMDSAGRSILSMLFSLFLVGLVVVFVFSFNRFLKGRTYHKLEMSPELGLEDQYDPGVSYLELDKDFLSCFIVIKELPQEGLSEDLIPGKRTNSSIPVKSGQIMRASCRGNYQDKKYYQLENGMYITANGKNVEPMILYVPVSGSLAITHVSSKGVQLRSWPDFNSETNIVKSVFVGDVVNVAGRLVLSDGKTGAYVTDEGYFIINNEKYFEPHVKDPTNPAADKKEEKKEEKDKKTE